MLKGQGGVAHFAPPLGYAPVNILQIPYLTSIHGNGHCLFVGVCGPGSHWTGKTCVLTGVGHAERKGIKPAFVDYKY